MLKLQTVQSSAIKTLFEVLKDILNDVNVVFDKDGIRIVAMDNSHVVLIYMTLSAESFEEYECDKEHVVGLNMLNMFKLLKIINNNDVLTMEINDDTMLAMNITNVKKKTTSKFNLKLLEIDDDMMEPPDLRMENLIPVPSTDFQKLCRDMANLGHNLDVKISRSSQGITFTCDGDFASQETMIEYENDCDQEVSEIYSLKYINTIAKATSLCPTVQLFLECDYPLLLKYEVAQLGEVCFCMAHRVES